MSTNRNFPAYGGVFGQRHVAGGYVATKVGSGAPIGAVAPQIWAQNVSVRGKCFERFVSVWRPPAGEK